jgi:hypothetical protein
MAAEIVLKTKPDKQPEREQALARDNFQLFAGVKGATVLNRQTMASSG